jgi:hypothetical protein
MLQAGERLSYPCILLSLHGLANQKESFFNKVSKYSEAVFLVMLGASSFPARHEVYGKTNEKLVPSWERARTGND